MRRSEHLAQAGVTENLMERAIAAESFAGWHNSNGDYGRADPAVASYCLQFRGILQGDAPVSSITAQALLAVAKVHEKQGDTTEADNTIADACRYFAATVEFHSNGV
jgi:hypothetical protein